MCRLPFFLCCCCNLLLTVISAIKSRNVLWFKQKSELNTLIYFSAWILAGKTRILRRRHSWPQTKSQSHFLSVFPSILHIAPGESAIKTNQPSRNPEVPSGQMRPWNCSIIFTWHRKEPTHNKRRTRWWQISLTLLRMKGESRTGGHRGARWTCAWMSPWGSALTFSTTWWRTHTYRYACSKVCKCNLLLHL